MEGISDWLAAFYSGTPTGEPIRTTASILEDAFNAQSAAPKSRTPTWMPMSVTPGASNPAPGVMGADGEVAPTGAVAGIPVPDIGEYFGRAIVIILGFIFVAAGLSMFREPLAQLAKA